MFLYFSYLSLNGHVHSCSLRAQTLEAHLDALNTFVANGHPLKSACLIDEEGRRTDLPLTAFDGQPIAPHLRALQEQYQSALLT